jgi:hypothetical protein
MAEKWWSKSVERASERKVRLFGAACCRLIWHLLRDERHQFAVEVAEQLADGLVDDAVRSQARLDAERMLQRDRHGYPQVDSDQLPVIWAIDAMMADPAKEGIEDVVLYTGRLWNMAAQIQLLREHFGDPERSVTFFSEWRTDTAILLARTMYESRDYSAMPILADALQDAGCDNDDVLSHCRDTSLTHVRGCWVVDLVLGKE